MPATNLAPQTLTSLYLGMVRIRMVEETIAQLYSEQEMRCPVHLSIGQEAPAVGLCAALAPTDYALSSHRSHAHYLAKGGRLRPMIAEIYGKETGCCGGKGGSMHLIDLEAGFLGAAPIVGSTIPIATGVALGTVMKKQNNVTVVFFGDAATEEGVFHESLNFAALKNLPIIFVCENNLYSVYSPLSVRQPTHLQISELAKAHGIKTYKANGNDIVEVYEIAQKAVNYARSRGPVFLEFATYRWLEHCGPNYDNDIGYRTEIEFNEWKLRCPITSFENRFSQSIILANAQIETQKAAFRSDIEDAFAFAKTSPFPEKEALFAGVFAA